MKNPIDVAVNLSGHYGHVLDRPVVYTQGVALSGRLRLHELKPQGPDPSRAIEALVRPHISSYETIFTANDGTANFAGLCWADELARSTNKDEYLELQVWAADRFGPTVDQGPLDPDFRVEDFFFAATMLGRAFRVSGKSAYARMLSEFLGTVDTLQSDGLWWHCNASPFYWGRGNGFAALGFSEALTYLEDDDPERCTLLKQHIDHLQGLAEHQDSSGMWRQVIDVPDSYLEHSATSMIGCALARGLRLGWLDNSWQPVVERAWDGLSSRISDDGSLEHVCVGTGPLTDLDSYINRPYTDGPDDRGGAMALWFAVEMGRLETGG